MKALEYIFKSKEKRNGVIRYLKSKGCTQYDAEDLYQDAIIIFDRKVVSGDYLSLSTIDNYIFSIVKLSWLNKYRQNKRRAEEKIEEEMIAEEAVAIYYGRQERATMMRKILSLFGERCLKMLHLFVHGYPIDDIAKAVGMVDAVRVRKEKYRCLNRMRRSVQQHPEFANFIKSQLTPGKNEI